MDRPPADSGVSAGSTGSAGSAMKRDAAAEALRGVRVVDLSTGIAGAYASKLFADAGADVVKVESPGGDPLRRHSASGADLGAEDGALFRFLHAGKRSVVGASGEPAVRGLIASADLVIESFRAADLEAAAFEPETLADSGRVV